MRARLQMTNRQKFVDSYSLKKSDLFNLTLQVATSLDNA